MRARAVGFLLGAAVLVIFSARLAFAQGSQIDGTVKDSSGGALPGVTVTVTQTATGLTRTVVTDAAGVYTLANLPVGPYRLEAMLQGFRTFRQDGIVLQVSTNPVVNVTLEVGEVAETITVRGNTTLVETRNPGIGQVVNNQQVLELPLNGRQPTQLILLAGMATGGAGAAAAQGAGALNSGVRNYPTVTISVAGGLSNGMAYVLDGGTHNDPFNNLNLPLPFPDALQEFKVETSALPAQYGHHSAAAVNAVTKSGTNVLHGSVFEFLRSDVLNATNAFAAVAADGSRRSDGLRRNQFGGTVGGPLIKNRLFYFAGYQGTLARVTPTSSFAFEPTPAMLAGDFSAITSAACNGGRAVALRAPFVNNTISPALFSKAALSLTSKLPAPTDPCGRVTFDRRSDSDEHIVIARVDYQWRNNHSLFGRLQTATYKTKADYDGVNAISYSSAPLDDAVTSFVLGDTYLLGPNTVSSFRATYNHADIKKQYAEFFDLQDIGVNAAVPMPNYLRMTVSGGFGLGGPSALPGQTPTKTLQLAEELSVVRGPHQIGFGVNFIHASLDAKSYLNGPGNFTFTGQTTGLGLADFLIGRPTTFTQGSITSLSTRVNYVGLYVQDSWRAASRVTINAGLRWDPYSPVYSDDPLFSHFSMDQFRANVRSTVFPNAPAGLIFQGDPGYPGNSAGERQLGNLAPRVGIAWDPQGNGLTTVRTAYGLFYDLPHLFSYIGFSGAPPFGNVISPTVTSFDNPWSNTSGGNPFPITPGPNMTFPNFGSYVTHPLDLKPPYSHQFNVSLQRQVGKDWLLAANYAGSRGRRSWVGDQLNPAVYIPGTCAGAACSTTANVNQRRVLIRENPQQGQFYGSIIAVDDSGSSDYNALLLSVQRRSVSGLSVQGNWTLAKCVSDNTNYEPGVAGTNLMIPGNPGADRGSCGNSDRRHVVNVSLVYQTPRRSGALGAFVSDWQLSSIITGSTGGHFSVTTGVDNALSGQTGERPNQVLDNVYANKGYQWLNAAAFSSPDPGTYGNLVVNSIEGPGRFNIDMGLVRSFRLGTDRQIQFRAEAFNVTNRVQLDNPVTALNSPTFGFITSAGDPRIIQLAVKLIF